MSDNLFLIFVEPLIQNSIPYMITGSVASTLYGEPRLTHDVDIVLELHEKQIKSFVGAFPLEHFYCPPDEVIKLELNRRSRGHFNLIHHETGYKADVYPMGQDPLHRWAMGQRRAVSIHGQTLHFAPPEYVIARKLEFFDEGGSEKHIRDVRGIRNHLRADLDEKKLISLLEQRGLRHLWSKVQEE